MSSINLVLHWIVLHFPTIYWIVLHFLTIHTLVLNLCLYLYFYSLPWPKWHIAWSPVPPNLWPSLSQSIIPLRSHTLSLALSLFFCLSFTLSFTLSLSLSLSGWLGSFTHHQYEAHFSSVAEGVGWGSEEGVSLLLPSRCQISFGWYTRYGQMRWTLDRTQSHPFHVIR